MIELLQKEIQPEERKGTSPATKHKEIEETIIKLERDIGHNVVKLVKELCSCVEDVLYNAGQYLLKLIDKYKSTPIGTFLEKLQNLAKFFEEQGKETKESCAPVLSWRYEELLELSQNEERLEKFLVKLEKVYRDADKIRNLTSIVIKPLEFASSILGGMRSELLRDLRIVLNTTLSVGLLVILSPHVARTRYPEIGFSPLNEYTKDHPLIKHFNKLLELLGRTLTEINMPEK